MNRLHRFLEKIEFKRRNPIHGLKLYPSKYLDLFVQNVDTDKVVYRTPLMLNVYWNPELRIKQYQLVHLWKNSKPAIDSELSTLFSKHHTSAAFKYAFITVVHHDIGRNNDWCHMNTLVFSYETNTVYLFEPHGSTRVKMLEGIKQFFHDVITDKRRSFYTNKWNFTELSTPPNKNHNGIQIKGEGNENLGMCVLWNFLVVRYIIKHGISSVQRLYYNDQKTLRHSLVEVLNPFWVQVKNKAITRGYLQFKGLTVQYLNQTCCFGQPINLTRNVINLTK